MSRAETDLTNIPSYAVQFAIPAELDFDELRLALAQDGAVTFNWTMVETICSISGVDVATLRNRPLLLVFMLGAWLTLLVRRGLVTEDVEAHYRWILAVMFDNAVAELGPLDPGELPPVAAGVRLIRPGTLH